MSAIVAGPQYIKCLPFCQFWLLPIEKSGLIEGVVNIQQ